MHVEESKGIGRLLCNGVSPLIRVLAEPGVIGKLDLIVAAAPAGRRASATRKFPFGLSRKPIDAPGASFHSRRREPETELDGLVTVVSIGSPRWVAHACW